VKEVKPAHIGTEKGLRAKARSDWFDDRRKTTNSERKKKEKAMKDGQTCVSSALIEKGIFAKKKKGPEKQIAVLYEKSKARKFPCSPKPYRKRGKERGKHSVGQSTSGPPGKKRGLDIERTCRKDGATAGSPRSARGNCFSNAFEGSKGREERYNSRRERRKLFY